MAAKDFPDFRGMTIDQLERAVRVLSAPNIACESNASGSCTLPSLDELSAFVGFYRQGLHILCDYHARKYGSAVFAKAKDCLPTLQELLHYKQMVQQSEAQSALYQEEQARLKQVQQNLEAAEHFLFNGRPKEQWPDQMINDLSAMLEQGRCPFCENNGAATKLVVRPTTAGNEWDIFPACDDHASFAGIAEDLNSHDIAPCREVILKEKTRRDLLIAELKRYYEVLNGFLSVKLTDVQIDQAIREMPADKKAALEAKLQIR